MVGGGGGGAPSPDSRRRRRGKNGGGGGAAAAAHRSGVNAASNLVVYRGLGDTKIFLGRNSKYDSVLSMPRLLR